MLSGASSCPPIEPGGVLWQPYERPGPRVNAAFVVIVGRAFDPGLRLSTENLVKS
jgi:hypothetical protein